MSTHIRIGGVRIDSQIGGTILDAAEGLVWITRANLRALRSDPKLREEALRRVLSPPCATRCYRAGFQYASDEEVRAIVQAAIYRLVALKVKK